MATFSSVKKRANSKSAPFLFFLFLVALSAGAGRLIWALTSNMNLALIVGGATMFLLYGWWFLFLWQTNITWLCRLQTTLFTAGILPLDFVFRDKASPWEVQSLVEGAAKAAGEVVKESERKIAANRHTLDKYLGSNASSHAVQGGSSTELGGQLQPVFILFSDIRGFTAMTEKLTPQETMRVLNQIYSSMGSVIEGAGGEINKFIGDAILAYFKMSTDNPSIQAEKIVRGALQMQDRFLQVAKRSAELKTKNIQIGMGIGIVAGQAILGNLGSRNRMEFTLIGDSVNLASRLCGIAPENEVLLNEDLALMVSQKFHIESRMPVQLKGKADKVTPYCVMGDLSNLSMIQPSVG